MTDRELIAALRRIGPETGSLCCLGCGYEHGCSVHGCAVIRAAITEIEHPAPPPNTPLTPDELREMGKDWVWIELLDPYYRMENGYYIKHEIEGPPRDSFQCGYPRIWVRDLPYSLYGDDWLAYRCRPEDGMA